MILKLCLYLTVLVSVATAGRVKRTSISCPPNKYGNNCEFTRCAANPCPNSNYFCEDSPTWDSDHMCICDSTRFGVNCEYEFENHKCPKGFFFDSIIDMDSIFSGCFPCAGRNEYDLAPECDDYNENNDNNNNEEKDQDDDDSDNDRLSVVDYAKIEKKSDRALQGVRDLRQGRLQIKLKQKIEKIAARVAHEEVLAALKAANLN